MAWCAAKMKIDRVQISSRSGEMGALDEVGLEAFRQGAIISEEELPHARPAEQWTALNDCLSEISAAAAREQPPALPAEAAFRGEGRRGMRISQLSQVMREICDAVEHETCKEVCTHSLQSSEHLQPLPALDARTSVYVMGATIVVGT
jgi:hypothetical protein